MLCYVLMLVVELTAQGTPCTARLLAEASTVQHMGSAPRCVTGMRPDQLRLFSKAFIYGTYVSPLARAATKRGLAVQ